MEDPKPTWGEDQLGQFINLARENCVNSFGLLYGEYRRIRDIDALFAALFEDYVDPEDPLAATFGLRCHSALRAAAQLALSGQLPETYMVLRGALEHALYAHHASSSEKRRQLWSDRGEDDNARKACAIEFSGRNIFPEIRKRDQRIGDVAGRLYERTIDFGAHPNTYALFSSMSTSETETHHRIEFSYIEGDGPAMQLAVRSWSQVAVSCLDVLSLVLPKRFSQLRITERTVLMRQGI